MPQENLEPKIVMVPITSDKGLCGAVNSSVVRNIKSTVAGQNRDRYSIFAIGDKGSTGL